MNWKAIFNILFASTVIITINIIINHTTIIVIVIALYTQKLRVDACNAGQKGRWDHPTVSISHQARLQ